jgi:hypothetical protein
MVKFYHTTVLLGDMWIDVSDGEIGNLMSVAINQMVVVVVLCEQQSAAALNANFGKVSFTDSRTWQGLSL